MSCPTGRQTARSRHDAAKFGMKLWTSLSADVNECVNGESRCHGNAMCTNTNGSYMCACLLGFSGNGRVCEGELPLHCIAL